MRENQKKLDETVNGSLSRIISAIKIGVERVRRDTGPGETGKGNKEVAFPESSHLQNCTYISISQTRYFWKIM
jgi:hypothetical protein